MINEFKKRILEGKQCKLYDWWEIQQVKNVSKEKTSHPCQIPEQVIKKIILITVNKDITVIDPFGGSGTTYAVAEAFERKWYGCELEIAYCDDIKSRLKDIKHLERIYEGNDQLESQKRRKNLKGIL